MLFTLWYLCRNLPNQRRYLEDMLKRSDTGYSRYWYNKQKKTQLASHRKGTKKMCLKKIISEKSKKIFCYQPAKSKQNKPITGHIHRTHKKQETAKHN